MKGHIIFSAASLMLLALYLKFSFPGGCPDKPFPYSQHSRQMRREIMERRKDLVSFYRTLLGITTDPEEAVEVDLEVPQTLTCKDLAYMTGLQYIGSGFTKVVVKGTLVNGKSIALKSVHGEGNDVKQCVQQYGDHSGCHRLATYKLQKEIALLQILRHPGIIQLHGQCYVNGAPSDIRVTAMMELGSPLEMIQLLQTPWEERFKICWELVQLLHYLANSPMGSIALLDFQPRQFVLVDGSLKVTDMDDANGEEPPCRQDADCALAFPARTFTMTCSETGRCTGSNEKRNLYNAYRFFFTYLLPHAAPPALRPLLDDIMNVTGDLHIGINQTLKAFDDVLNLYKSGMSQSQEHHLHDYTVLRGFRMNDTDGDFRCWPSYNHQGCLLSVHSAEEAAEFCKRRPQCRHFVISQQKTWTGRYLTAFTKNSLQFVPDENYSIYVKRSGHSDMQEG
ncbi:extracellular tyrosine-protein kinase PKDCC-like [Bufo gargarizans]|uniref:extracellular tyrosine-protein kinase PKDCC-like n=1 Tax=Bufo gargarizans TaxID=30331 RepID=UPI001CF3D0B8|nr:extracellular tyrosine-protein kinase PKDCC-like [Bufo gargarizans]